MQALQWTGKNDDQIAEFASANVRAVRGGYLRVDYTDIRFSLWEVLTVGDWLIKYPNGRIDAVRVGKLRETYEFVNPRRK